MSDNAKKRKLAFRNICRALSCFMPLYLVFLAQNVHAAWSLYTKLQTMKFWENLGKQSDAFWLNVVMSVVWIILFLFAVRGISEIRAVFLEDWDETKGVYNSAADYVLMKVENNTADFYFTYFSLFVLSFFGVDPTKVKDCLIFIFVMVLIVWVYISNELYHINPVLNLAGYRIFTITAHKDLSGCENMGKEIKVLTKDQLIREVGQKISVKFSPYDFTVCRLKKQKK